MQIKTTMRYHLTAVRMATVKKPRSAGGCGEREPCYTVGGNVNWCNHCGKQYGVSLRKLKIELPCDPAIPFMGISPDETIIQKDMHSYGVPSSQDMEAT